jgi:hypothetical protein
MASRRGNRFFQVEDSWGNEEEKCLACGKTVYPGDRLSVEKVIYHKTCFRCAECKSTLSLGSYASIDSKFYCKPHFKQLFKLKGNYSEGFGAAKPTAKWDATSPTSDATTTSDAPLPIDDKPPQQDVAGN